jgi:Fur family peroxide stress response transcriptional regulator
MPRFSPQRETILNIVKDHGGHLSVDDIYKQARATMPRISLGTVYRNLKTLEEMKEVTHTQGMEQATFYSIYSEPHHHFICKQCGEIRDIDAPTVNICTGCITSKVPLKVEDVVTTLYGVCEGCMN